MGCGLTLQYTMGNLKFARSVEPDNKAVSDKMAWLQQ